MSYNSQPGDKQVIMDIKAITGKRVQIDVEMQNGNLLYYANRSIYYSGVMITNSLAKGESYDKMKRSIVITIVNGKLFKDIPDCYTQFAYADKKSHKILSDVSELHFLELGKIDISKPLEEMTSVEKLGAYLMIAGDESQEEYLQQLLNLKEEAINMSEYVFKELTVSEVAEMLEMTEEEVIKAAEGYVK
ncbi:MAG: PD-(D/E)XK nuclease family transposase [Anaerovoracaceae bacterium]